MQAKTEPITYRPYARIVIENPPNGARALRFYRGLSSGEVARLSGIPSGSIRRFEINGTGISNEKRKKLAEVLGVELWQLYDPKIAEKLAREDIEKNPILC